MDNYFKRFRIVFRYFSYDHVVEIMGPKRKTKTTIFWGGGNAIKFETVEPPLKYLRLITVIFFVVNIKALTVKVDLTGL